MSLQMAHPALRLDRAPATGGPYVDADVDALRTVLVHRPGDELCAVPAADPAAALFAAPMNLRRAQDEHDAFVSAMEARGVEVLHVRELAAEVLAAPATKDEFLRRALAGAPVATRRAIDALPPGRAAAALITGGPGLESLPNLLFTRDQSAWIGSAVAVGTMREPVRRREPRLLAALYATHPRFARAGSWASPSSPPAGVEGGDVLPLGDGRLVIGVSERTVAAHARRLAAALLTAGAAREILLLRVPPAAGFHLDLMLAMVDHASFAFWAPARHELRARVCRMTAAGPTAFAVEDPLAWLARDARIIEIGDDGPEAHGRRWDHGTNVLALAPGVVLAYADNTRANRRLAAAGIDVVAVPGAELANGRGGPHCLSGPIRREPRRSDD